MAFNPDAAGRSYEAPAEILDRERHLAYALAVGVPQQEAPQLARPLACFASVYLLWPLVPQLFSDPEVGLDLPRLLHGEQEFSFERALEFGEAISPQGVVAQAEIRRGMAFLDFRCEGRDSGGLVVARSRSLFVVREAA